MMIAQARSPRIPKTQIFDGESEEFDLKRVENRLGNCVEKTNVSSDVSAFAERLRYYFARG